MRWVKHRDSKSGVITIAHLLDIPCDVQIYLDHNTGLYRPVHRFGNTDHKVKPSRNITKLMMQIEEMIEDDQSH